MHREEISVLGKPMATAPTERFETTETANSNSNGKNLEKSVAPRTAHPSDGVRPIFLPLENRGFGGNAPQGTEEFAQSSSGVWGQSPHGGVWGDNPTLNSKLQSIREFSFEREHSVFLKYVFAGHGLCS